MKLSRTSFRGILYTCIIHFLPSSYLFYSLCAFSSANSSGSMFNSDSEKKCFPWEKSSNRSGIHSCLSQWFPVLQQLNLFISPAGEKFLWIYSKTKIIWGICDHRDEIWCSEVHTLPLTWHLLLYPSVPVIIPSHKSHQFKMQLWKSFFEADITADVNLFSLKLRF